MDKQGQILQNRRRTAGKTMLGFLHTYIYPHTSQNLLKGDGRWIPYLCSRLDFALAPNGRLVGAIPREHAKTTIGTTALVTMCVCYKRKMNIVIIGANQREASDKMRNIVQELETNPLLRADFGDDILPMRSSTGVPVANNDQQVIFNNGVRVAALGICGKIRGQNVRGRRVDLVVMDDPEDDVTAASLTMRERGWEWVRAALVASLDERGSIIWLGTIVHHDALLMRAMGGIPGWEVMRLAAHDEKRIPLWPEQWPIERLDQRRQEIGSAKFAQEYLNNPIDPESQIFKPEWWRYYDKTAISIQEGRYFISVAGQLHPLMILIGFDPAVGVSRAADFCGLMVIGQDLTSNNLYMLECKAFKASFSGQIDHLRAAYERWRANRIAIESSVYQAALAQAAIDAGLPVTPLKPIGPKKERIQTASVHVEMGRFMMPVGDPNVQAFTDQAEAFPKGVHDDLLDAYTMAVELVNFGGNKTYLSPRKRHFHKQAVSF